MSTVQKRNHGAESPFFAFLGMLGRTFKRSFLPVAAICGLFYYSWAGLQAGFTWQAVIQALLQVGIAIYIGVKSWPTVMEDLIEGYLEMRIKAHMESLTTLYNWGFQEVPWDLLGKAYASYGTLSSGKLPSEIIQTAYGQLRGIDGYLDAVARGDVKQEEGAMDMQPLSPIPAFKKVYRSDSKRWQKILTPLVKDVKPMAWQRVQE